MDRRPTALMQSPDGGKIPSRDAVRPSSPADICMYAETRSTKSKEDQHEKQTCKTACAALAAALLTACMAGCTGKTEQPAKAEATEKAEPAKDSTPADEEITLTFWHTYGDAEEAQFKDVVLPLWEKAHPNIKDRRGAPGRRSVPRDDRHLLRHRHEFPTLPVLTLPTSRPMPSRAVWLP